VRTGIIFLYLSQTNAETGMEITRTFDLLELYKRKYRKEDALATKRNGEWVKYSSDTYVEQSNFFSYGLLGLGLKRGDKIAIISNNRPEWNFIDMGMAQIGVVSIPIYPTISAEDYKYILNHAEPQLVITSDRTLYDKVQPLSREIQSVIGTYTINYLEGISHWKEIVESGKKNVEKYKQPVDDAKSEIKPEDMATLIYTSGTTGFPKGVMLSHHNLVSNFKAVRGIHEFNETHRTLSFLPLCHVFERMVNYHFQYIGVSIYYAENMGAIADNLKEVKPHVFISVPRLLEGVYDKILAKGKDLTLIKKAIFNWAIKLGLKFKYNKGNGPLFNMKLSIADGLVFKKWREALGGNTSLIIVGGAALQPRLSRVFGAAGINALEGYGLTETAPVIAVNNIVTGEICVGSVGPVLPGLKVKIADDGEILVKGPNVMLGYYKEPELTNEVIDTDGWFHTGDIGKMIDNKYLKITDRKKEIFKLSSGKYIAPQVIENKFKESFFIEQIMVIGENEKFASALISPNFGYLHNWATHHHISFRDNLELVKHPKVVKLYQEEVNRMNTFFGQTEQIKRFRLVCDEWTPQSGALSPTLKLRRKFLYNKYESLMKEIYANQKNGNSKGT
jgi:long-chain acyl-CoA synthetase